jgi:hypothetical protein
MVYSNGMGKLFVEVKRHSFGTRNYCVDQDCTSTAAPA